MEKSIHETQGAIIQGTGATLKALKGDKAQLEEFFQKVGADWSPQGDEGGFAGGFAGGFGGFTAQASDYAIASGV